MASGCSIISEVSGVDWVHPCNPRGILDRTLDQWYFHQHHQTVAKPVVWS
ncbi:unnamed protein product [Phyllotreta striolata]|uniref:Uncharacterized protein n=1 Tax=Phyllotreta striolata TaxID=444603 RepID=A0A9N9TF45_PHYSR|nr:unnamed protein product [Phyllotreta striolata]